MCLITLRNTTWQNLRFQHFLKNKEAMEASDVAKGVTIVHSKQRPQIIDEVEKLLSIWTKEIFWDGDSISEGKICRKAMRI